MQPIKKSVGPMRPIAGTATGTDGIQPASKRARKSESLGRGGPSVELEALFDRMRAARAVKIAENLQRERLLPHILGDILLQEITTGRRVGHRLEYDDPRAQIVGDVDLELVQGGVSNYARDGVDIFQKLLILYRI